MAGLTMIIGLDGKFVIYEQANPTRFPQTLSVSLIGTDTLAIYNWSAKTAYRIQIGKSRDIGMGAVATYKEKAGRKARISVTAPEGIGIDRMSVYRKRFKT